MLNWHPKSWQASQVSQQAKYPDREQLDQAIKELSGLPPLVSELEIDN